VTKPLQIGITGGIGSGKSLVCKIFSQLGVPVYDADSHAKRLMTTDGILISGIKKEFGDLSYHTDGMLNRTYLADHVFNDEEKLKTLNSLVHPRVKKDYERWLGLNNTSRYVLKEAALLFEAGTDRALDKIIVVHAPEDVRIRRVLSRDAHRTDQQTKAIMAKQMPEEEKLKKADFVILNDETTLVIPQVMKLHQQFSLTQG
jgi:dephospho-CoA kinase